MPGNSLKTSSPVPPVQQPNMYEKWHNTDHHRMVHWGLFVLIIVIAWFSVSGQIDSWVNSFSDTRLSVNLPKAHAQISLDPQMKSVMVGEKFSIDIILDTASEPVDGVDIYSLHYDPSLLRVADDNTSVSGVQIKAGSLMALNAANIVDSKTGTIKFSQVASGGSNYKGKGVLATVNFTAISQGTAYLKFDFQKGSTIDTNTAFKGKDQLARVVDAIIEVKEQ